MLVECVELLNGGLGLLRVAATSCKKIPEEAVCPDNCP